MIKDLAWYSTREHYLQSLADLIVDLKSCKNLDQRDILLSFIDQCLYEVRHFNELEEDNQDD